jgi:hypothetical protein
MRTKTLKLSIFFGVLVGTLCSATAAPAAEADWKAVEQALGKPGQLQLVTSFVSGCRGAISP